MPSIGKKYPRPVYQYPHEVSPIPQPRFTGLCRRVRVFAGGPPPRASRRVRDGDEDEDEDGDGDGDGDGDEDEDEDGDGDDLAHQAADAARVGDAVDRGDP